MPKKVDYEARRLELADALWRLTRREGWDAISVRKVAAEAGVSVGMVQHAFASTDQMLAFAIQAISENVVGRVRARVAALPRPVGPRDLIAVSLTEMVPDTERHVDEIAAAAVFIRRFLLNPDAAQEISAANPSLRGFLVEQLTAAHCADVELTADTLLALLDGVIYGIVSGQLDTGRAVRVIEAAVDRACP